MKTTYKLFHDNVLVKDSHRVLLGSPEVGKSVLFFIAALYKAEHGDKPVVYFRRTEEEDDISAFFMVRTDSGVRVYSCRDIDMKAEGAQLITISCASGSVNIDTKSIETVRSSAAEGFAFTQ